MPGYAHRDLRSGGHQMMLGLLFGGALASGMVMVPDSRGPSIGTGAQTVTVIVRNLPSGGRVQADLDGMGPIVMEDPGIGYSLVHFRVAPTRTAHLRLVSLTTGRQPLVDQTLLLVDPVETIVTYEVSGLTGQLKADRIPGAPSVAAVWAPEEDLAIKVRFGWAALGLGYVVSLALVWARRA